MNLKWTDIAFWPDDSLADEVAAAWRWFVPEPWTLIVCSMFGGIFLEKASGGVFWLECGTGLIERVADSRGDFESFLRADRDDAWVAQIEEWFLTGFVEELHAAGKRPGPGQCFALTILPVFEGGRYEVGNVYVVAAREWLTLTASVHEQLRDLPDGAKVKIEVTE